MSVHMWDVHSVLFMFREVFKARNRKTNHIVALKKVRMENEKEGVCIYLFLDV